MALAALLIGIGLLSYYVYEVPRLEPSVRNQVYYVVLFPSAIACALALFGAMRSYARLTASHVGVATELSGPVVLFVLIVWGGFKLVPPALDTFDLTVRAHSADGSVPIIKSGKVTVDLDSDRRTELFGPNGEADFKGVPAKFMGLTIKILPEVDGYETKWQRHKILRNVLELPLSPAPLPQLVLKGTVEPAPGPKTRMRVVVEGQNGTAVVDDVGRFEITITGQQADRVRLRVFAGSRMVYDDFQQLPGPVTLKIPRLP